MKVVVFSNMALIQTQAIIVTFFASAAAIVLSWIPRGEINFQHASLLCASSLMTASMASFILSAVMVLVVLVSKRFDINPDNVATPIAASLGIFLGVFCSEIIAWKFRRFNHFGDTIIFRFIVSEAALKSGLAQLFSYSNVCVFDSVLVSDGAKR